MRFNSSSLSGRAGCQVKVKTSEVPLSIGVQEWPCSGWSPPRGGMVVKPGKNRVHTPVALAVDGLAARRLDEATGGELHLERRRARTEAQSALGFSFTGSEIAWPWGINFESVEPFNEPSSSWWKSDNNQEGCNFDSGAQEPIIKALRQADSRGLNWMAVSASDENTYTLALATWKDFEDNPPPIWKAPPILKALDNNNTRSYVGRINVHGYEYEGGRRDLLYSAAAGTKIWNSEYGEGDTSGMRMATNLNFDLRWLHPAAWSYWQMLDGSGMGLDRRRHRGQDDWYGEREVLRPRAVYPAYSARNAHH